jgi:hypothetical protein
VAACAASEMPRLSRRGTGSHGAPLSSRLVSGVAHATSPAVAAADKLEPDVADRGRLDDEHRRDGPREPDHRPGAAPALNG